MQRVILTFGTEETHAPWGALGHALHKAGHAVSLPVAHMDALKPAQRRKLAQRQLATMRRLLAP